MPLPCHSGGRPPAAPRCAPHGGARIWGTRRVVAASAVALAAVAALTGCSSLVKALGQQQAVVSFADGTSATVRLQVRAACGTLPNVSPVPLPAGVPQSQSLDTVVFNIDHASTVDEARLQMCLSKYKSVTGMDIQDSTDMGN